MAITDPQFSLRSFMEVLDKTSAECLKELEQAAEFLERIDLPIRELIDGAGTIKPPIAGVLLMNSHASFRAAVHLTLTGQLPSVFMALRGALESAMYATLIVNDPKLQEIWLDRHKNLEARNRCKNAFTPKNCFRALATIQHKEFANDVRDQYDAAIDFGAHPNSKSLMNSVRLSQLEGGEHALELAYVHGCRSTELRQCVVACAEIGTSIAFIGLICLPAHPNLKALNDRLLAYQAALPDLVTVLGLRMGVA